MLAVTSYGASMDTMEDVYIRAGETETDDLEVEDEQVMHKILFLVVIFFSASKTDSVNI